MPNYERAYKRQICRAVTSGDWVEASSWDPEEIPPNWVSTPLTEHRDTALHIAVSLEQTSFVDKLVKRLSVREVEIRNADGNTAFCMAAISGNVEIATILLNKNPGLVWIRGHNDTLPIHLASSAGQPHMVKFLCERTCKDMGNIIPFEDIVRLFSLALANSIYIVASILLKTYPELATTEDEQGLTALEVLAQLSFDEDAPGYQDILNALLKVMEEEDFLDSERTSKVMFDAAASGNTKILEFFLMYNPNLSMKKNPKEQTLLHIAIFHRQEAAYGLILTKGAYKNAIMQEVDYEGNNVLHLAGKLPIEERFASPKNHALIHVEEMWFQEVERIVPPVLKTMRNTEGLTPQELFLKEHRELSEKAVSDLNQMANTFLVASTLIVTLGMTAALTVDANKIQGKTHFLSRKTWYIIFLLSVGAGTALAAISMLFFTSAILLSVLKQKGVGHVSSRKIRVIYGCWTLLASIAIMATFSTTSGAALMVVYNFIPKWILYSSAALGGIGLILFYIIYRIYVPYMLHFLHAHCERVAQVILSMTGTKWGHVPVVRPLFWYKVRTG